MRRALARLALALALVCTCGAVRAPATEAPVPPLALTAAERAYLDAHPVLRLGVNVGATPYLDVHRADGKPHLVGLAADYLTLLGKMLGVRFAPRYDIGLPRALELAQAGEIDLLPCLALTPGRTRYLHYTRPFISQPYVLVARRREPITGIEDLAGRTLAVIPAYVAYNRLSRDHPGLGAKYLFLQNGAEALDALDDGRADATIISLAHATSLLARHDDLHIVMPLPWPQNALAMASPDPVLAGIVQKGLDAIPEATRRTMEARAYRIVLPPPAGPDWRLQLLLAAGLLPVLALLAWWLRRRTAIYRERRAMQAALQAQRELLEVVFNATADAIIVLDHDYRILASNRIGAIRFGKDIEGMVGQNILDFTEAPVAATRREHYLEAQTSGRAVHFTDLRAGHIYDNMVQPLPNPAGGLPRLAIYARDITARRLAETALRENKERLDKIFRLIPVVISISSLADSRYIEINEAFTTITGFSREEALGRTITDLKLFVNPADRETIVTTVAREGLIRNFELPLRLKDGRQGTGLFSGLPLEAYGQPCLLSVVVDITGRKAMEEALRLAKDSAEAANRAKSRFLSTMSHEIRTPMNTILGMVDVLRGTPLSDRQKRFLATLEGAGEDLMALLTDILELSKIESGSVNWAQVPYDPLELARQAAQTLRVQAERKGLTLTVAAEEDVPREVRGDPARLRQILVNLLCNAVKFTHKGSIRLDLRRLGGQALCDELVFRVADTGIGIAPEQQQAIFEPFTQADASTTRAYGGTGLGLAISALLTQGLGGRLWVESELGRGSTFYCALPLESRPGPNRPPRSASGRMDKAAIAT